MKFAIDKNELEKQIASVFGAAGDGKTLPITSHILIAVKDNTLTMSATDLSTELTSTVPVLEGTDGLAAMPAKKMQEIVKELPSGVVSFALNENGTVTISAGKARFNIATLNAQEFPVLKKAETESIVQFGAVALAMFLNMVKVAICNDETKYNLCGIHIQSSADGKSLELAATNGHRLNCLSREKELPAGFLPEKGITIPKKGCLEIIKLADTLKEDGKLALAYKDNALHVMTENVRLAVRLLEGDFPDYKRVIPTGEGNIAVVKKQELSQALKRTSLVIDGKENRVKLVFSKGLLHVSANGPTTGDAVEEFEIQYEGQPTEVNLNSRYALDAISSLEKEKDEELRMTLFEDGKPVMFQGMKPGFIGVVMPMRA